jgi:NTP pyrophosphatase (non-canonical NTP hydrolase)
MTDEPGAYRLYFDNLSEANLSRVKRWHTDFLQGSWSGADWGLAMCGEAGEAANVVKKLRRVDTGHPSVKDPDRAELLHKLALELADVRIYMDLLAQYYGIDVEAAIVEKFNTVSRREGFPERLKIVD